MNVAPDFNIWSQLINEFEGCKLKAYLDSGNVPTIGFGTTYLYDKKRKVKLGDVISFADATSYFKDDSAEVVRKANLYIKKPLNATQSIAVCDYIYNRGIGNFLNVQYRGWGLDDVINLNPLDPKIPQIIEQTGWKDKLGNILNGLVRRRKSEALLYRTGVLKFRF